MESNRSRDSIWRGGATPRISAFERAQIRQKMQKIHRTFLETQKEKREQKQAFMAGYLEAQAKQRTACLCKDMVLPLSTPLRDRIVAMALIINGQR